MLKSRKKISPLFLLLLCSGLWVSAAIELTLNGYKPEFKIDRDNEAWHYHYERKLQNAAPDEVWGPELGLSRRGWKQHPKYQYIRGYNGDISVKILVSGSISSLAASVKITNYADSESRQASLSYSLNGVDYLPLAQENFTGTAVISGAKELSANRGVLWLRFQRHLAEGDQNGRAGFVLLADFSFQLSGAYPAEAIATAATAPPLAAESYRVQNFFPTGVFWPWERTKANAEFAQMELWAFVEQTMRTLREHHCNTLWFVNIGPGEDARHILLLAEKYGLKVLLNTELLSAFYHGLNSLDQAEQLARNTVNEIADSPALLAYVLKDEPQLCSVAQLSYLYQIMKKHDPLARDSVAVVMNRQTQTYLEDSILPVICTDIYYFGHDHSTNIPNPSSVSQREFRHGVKGMNAVAERYGKHSWLMPQMFGDTWGRHYRRGDKMVVEPGSYLHWRMPTLAETSWQIWEGLRLGSKGMIFYVLYPPIPLQVPPAEVVPGSPEAKKVERMDRSAEQARSWKKQRLTATELEIDPGEGVLQPGGCPTPQMVPMAEAFRVIREHDDLLTRRRKADFPVFFAADSETELTTFVDPNQPEWRYGIVVNSNLNEARQLQILLPPNVLRVTNLNLDEQLSFIPTLAPFQACQLNLAAGDGCLLRAEFINDEPGRMFFRENFAQHDQFKVKLNLSSSQIVRFGSFGMFPFYGVQQHDSGSEEPVFSVENLTNRKSAANTILMNLNNTREQGKVFCLLEGDLAGVRLFAVDNSISAGEETNVMHLQEQNVDKKAEAKNVGKSTLLQEKEFFRPAQLPVGTTSLQVFMNPEQKTALISNITIWFVPN
ncbi:MAG: hypothetical protein WCT05_13420 [Lentisphaeria bacterium]